MALLDGLRTDDDQYADPDRARVAATIGAVAVGVGAVVGFLLAVQVAAAPE